MVKSKFFLENKMSPTCELSIGVTHANVSGSRRTTLVIDQPDVRAIVSMAREMYQLILEEYLLAPARILPPVQTFLKLGDKFWAMADDDTRIRLARKQIEIDHERAALDLSGESLVTAMNEIEVRRQEATEQLDAHQRAMALFTPRLDAARATAVQALSEHLHNAIQIIHGEINRRIAEAKAAIDVAISPSATSNVLTLLDAHAVTILLSEYLGIERRVESQDHPWQAPTAMPAGFVSLRRRVESVLIAGDAR